MELVKKVFSGHLVFGVVPFIEIQKLLSVTCIVSGLLCPPRFKVLRPRNSALGKHLLFPQVKTPLAVAQPSA